MNRRTATKLMGLLGLRAMLPVGLSWAAPPGGRKEVATVDLTSSFAYDLYGQLRGKSGNVFLSPLSIQTALAMTSVGARGQTLAEMIKVLQLPDAGAAYAGMGELLKSLESAPGAKYELAIANALWGQQDLPFHKEFLAETEKHFGATLHKVDFKQAEAARTTINRWVEQHTKDKIKDLIPDGSIDASTKLVLTNAVYFKGKWSEPFQKSQTTDQPFKLANGSTVTAPLMRQGGNFRYLGDEGLQIVDLPYAGDKFSMTILLPSDPDGLPAIEKRLSTNQMREWTEKLHHMDGDVYLPRFKTSDRFELAKTLATMGMGLAFSDAADFSGMCADPLKIAFVVHKAYVDTNEEGSEAAAATGVGMKLAAAPIPQNRFNFRADHPFLFIIRDSERGTPLFIGRISDPTK